VSWSHLISKVKNTNVSCSDYAEQVWIWESEGGTEFFFDVGEVVRFRVESEEWHDQIPNAPDVADETPQERRPPYSILVGFSTWKFLNSH
jgi:DNA-directed RNA polymerase subunit E'/Rpb7